MWAATAERHPRSMVAFGLSASYAIIPVHNVVLTIALTRERRTRYAIYLFRIVVNLFFRFPVIMRLTVATYSEHGRWFPARAQ
jgi:hypothetical protein